ncbi:MAG: two-component regulator propeller domain-containing protein [Bacteroidales bacterium]|nr:two-component regulator propeller domain-containing protein [Bacteroidales bacterium]
MMSRLRLYFFFLSFISFSFSGQAQGIGIGQWRTHMPYQHVIDVEIADQLIYAATPYELMIYNTEDNWLSQLNKVNGLSDIGISTIRYSKEYKTLLVAYTNANIDLIKPEGIVSLTDIKNKELMGNKTINSIRFRDKYAFLACGFGIVVLDIVRQEVFDTYFIGPQGGYINVNDVEFFQNTIFAATEKGVYYASLDSPNLADFNQWSFDTRLKHPFLNYNLLESFHGKLYLNYTRNEYNTDTLFMFDGNQWAYAEQVRYAIRRQIRAYDNQLLVANQYNVYLYDQDMELIQSVYAPEGTGIEPYGVAMDGEKNIWIGDRRRGLLKTFNSGHSAEVFMLNGPATTNVYELKARGSYVWVASGGRRNNWGKMYMNDGIFSYDGNRWKTHNSSNTSGFDTITDYVSVGIDPLNPNIAYIGTWHKGVVEFTNFEKTEFYSIHNSSLGPWLASPKLINISGLDFDSYNNLWVCNTGAANILSMRKPTGEWQSFFLGSNASGIDVGNMIVDKSNYKWIIRRSEGKIIVFNDNNTFDDISDDQIKILTSSPNGGNIPGNAVYSMAVDHDGGVWVGTDKGPVVFYNPERIFQQNTNFDAVQILVPRNDGTGQADYLLGSEKILSIAVDGSNKKWFGTENGVFLMSKDGLEQIHYFNSDNSPLLSNTVNSIAITADGEVFFGTSQGIISYKGNATEPPVTHTDVYAYPNPVRQEYQGPIAIKGIVRDAIVKITDMSGNLVYQTRSEGGQAVWDGRILNGNHVKPGIYLVFITDDQGMETLATKVMVMRTQ